MKQFIFYMMFILLFFCNLIAQENENGQLKNAQQWHYFKNLKKNLELSDIYFMMKEIFLFLTYHLYFTKNADCIKASMTCSRCSEQIQFCEFYGKILCLCNKSLLEQFQQLMYKGSRIGLSQLMVDTAIEYEMLCTQCCRSYDWQIVEYLESEIESK